MEVNNLIEWLKFMKKRIECDMPGEEGYLNDDIDKIDEIIKRLQMWKGFKTKYGIRLTKLPMSANLENLYDLMNIFEKKHLSKRINRIIEVEVEASNMEVIDELATEISDMANGQSHRKGKIMVRNTRWIRD